MLWGGELGMCFPDYYKFHHDCHLVCDLSIHFFDMPGPQWPLSLQSKYTWYNLSLHKVICVCG